MKKLTLSAKNLQKSYQARMVVKSISLSVEQGQIVGLLGPNGAGKTTSFYMIVGLVKPEQGHIYLGEQDITKTPIHARARLGIGYLPQEPSAFKKLSVKKNILAIAELRKDLSPQAQGALAATLMKEFGITHLADTLSVSLSGGERRRLEIARALAMEPKFILLDEPFAGIDPLSVIDIKAIIKQLAQRDIGVIITDHNVRETLDICEVAYIASQGRILASGTPSDILSNQVVKDTYLGNDFSI